MYSRANIIIITFARAHKCVCVCVCVRARQFLPARQVSSIGQKRILPTKPKISRLITRRLIECRSFRALSVRRPPFALPPLSLSVSSVSPFFVVPPLCRSLPPGVRPLRYQQRSPSDSAALSCERPSPPTSFRRLRSRSSFSSATSRPPHLIHIHAVVIVCRLPAGGHYYTSCARSRHREATMPATLLLLLPFPSPTLLLIRFPHPAAAAAADAVVFRLYVARLCNDTTPVTFTIASPGIIRGRITQFPRRASLSVGCARASLQIIARKLFLKMPRKET